MRKVLGVIALLFSSLFLFVSCQASLSASNIKSNLKGAGYTADEYTPAQYEQQQQGALEATKIEGLEVVVTGYKDDSNIIILVFNSIDNASKAVENTDVLSVMTRFGSKNADEGQTSSFGSHNNVVWAGSAKARNAAGINI